MVREGNDKSLRGMPPPPDDSWWEAVLTDVENRFASKVPREVDEQQQSTAQENTAPKQTDVDWQLADTLYQQDQIIRLTVRGWNRGGLLVSGQGIQGFVPLSHIVSEKIKDYCDEEEAGRVLEEFVGMELPLKIIECDQERGRIVLSARAAQANPGVRLKLLDKLKVGQIVTGCVTTVTDFGVFIELGGVEGLIHISELSWGRVRHPSDLLKTGERVDAFVLNIDRQRSRVALSLKRLHRNPWENVEERYSPGQVIDAVITSVVPYGAFARLEDGLDGLIHVSEYGELSNGHNGNGSSLIEGQKVKVSILHIDAERQRLGLSLNIDQGE